MKKTSIFHKDLIASIICALANGKDLSVRESLQLFTALFSGVLTPVRAKAALLLLAKKGETACELFGCVHALLTLETPAPSPVKGLIDTCGTGGDGSCTLNISTLAAIVIAGAGGRVAKHGNRAVSSRSGSSDLMESFGVKLNASRKQMLHAIRRAGIGYFHAPYHHPVFSRFHSLRRSLKRRTILNLLGPLVNPLRIDHQLVGVAQPQILSLYAKVLARLGRHSALVCHSNDHLDEISTRQKTRCAIVRNGKIRFFTINPKKFGLQPAGPKDLRVNGPVQSFKKSVRILRGIDQGPARDIVVLNAAAGLWLTGEASSLKEGILFAQHSIDSGKAFAAIQKLRSLSQL